MPPQNRGECSEATLLNWANVDGNGRRHHREEELAPHYKEDEIITGPKGTRKIIKVLTPEGGAHSSKEITYVYENQ